MNDVKITRSADLEPTVADAIRAGVADTLTEPLDRQRVETHATARTADELRKIRYALERIANVLEVRR